MMRVGIIGTGRMAKARTEALKQIPQADIRWICSRDRGRAESFIESYTDRSGIEPAADWEEAVKRKDTDAVIITTPNTLHRPMTLAALEAGKHVLTEFPHGATPEEGLECIASAEKRGLLLHSGLTHRYSPEHQKLKKLMREGKEENTVLGKPVSYQEVICSGNPISRWYGRDELSGGMFVSSLFHFIDELRDFFGEPVDSAGAYHSRREEDGKIVRDTGEVFLTFPGKLSAHISYARGMKKPGLGRRRTVIFEEGYFIEQGAGPVLLTPSGEVSPEFPAGDPLLTETRAFITGNRAENRTVRESQASLELAWSLMEKAGLRRFGR
jgi:predicted dehydrogenase